MPSLKSTRAVWTVRRTLTHNQTFPIPYSSASRATTNRFAHAVPRLSSYSYDSAHLGWPFGILPSNPGINQNNNIVNAGVRRFSSSTKIDDTNNETPPDTTNTPMADEYGEMTADGETHVETNFQLEDGTVLPKAQLRYQIYGTINAERDNVMVVCHALTGNASLHSWWGELLGPGKAFDTSKYMILCCNILGSCYGSTSPRTINPKTGKPYSKDFPDISVKDTVRLQLLLLKSLKVKSVKAVIGGSFGGMQAIEFAVQAGSAQGDFFDDNGTHQKSHDLSLFPVFLDPIKL